jgi:hypothetical protein
MTWFFLMTNLLPHYPMLRSLKRGLKALSEHAVDTRYPIKRTTKAQALSATRWAEKVRKEARTLLGIKDKPKRKKQR